MDLNSIINTPLFQQAQKMYDGCGGDVSKVEQVAKNICESKGIDYQQALQAFKQMMGQKL